MTAEFRVKRDGRKLDHRTLEEIRKMAVERVREGEKPSGVIASYGFHRCAVYRWLQAANGRGHGIRARAARKGAGRPRKLTPAQERQVFRWINGKNPMQYGFDFGLWTRRIAGELVEMKFGIKLGLASVGALLARQGLTARKPLQRAYQRDPEAIERWQRETYPALAAKAKHQGAEISFWDESGFRADSAQGKSWGIIRANAGSAGGRPAAEHQRGLGGQREGGILVFHLPRRAQWRVVGGTAQEVDAPAQEAAASGAGWLARLLFPSKSHSWFDRLTTNGSMASVTFPIFDSGSG